MKVAGRIVKEGSNKDRMTSMFDNTSQETLPFNQRILNENLFFHQTFSRLVFPGPGYYNMCSTGRENINLPMKTLLLNAATSLNLIFVWGVFIIILITPPMALVALLITPFDRKGNGIQLLARTWTRIVIAACFIKVNLEGTENIAPGEPFIFAANHSSVFDHLVLQAYLPGQARFLAKAEVFSLPFFSWVFTRAGHIPINRTNAKEGMQSLDEAAEKIRGGLNLVIYPEGTRSKDGAIHEFKRGGFLLAVKTGHRIIPVSISGAHRIMPTKSLRVYPGSIKVVFGRPIAVKGQSRKDQTELMTGVRQAIIAGFDPDYGGGMSLK